MRSAGTTGSPTPPLLPDGVRPASDWPAPRLVPTSYPGTAPDHHYLLLGDDVVPLRAGERGGGLRVELPDGAAVDAVLAEVGAAPLAERVPVLAYGANRSPHTLAVKLVHHGNGRGRPRPAVPVLRGTIDGVDVVGSGLSSQGFVDADIAPSPGTRITAYLTLLDRDQAAAVHESEGVGRGGHDCAWMSGFQVEGTGLELDVVAYAGCRPVFVSPATQAPLAFSVIPAAQRRFQAVDQVTLFGTVLEATGILDDVAELLGPIDRREPVAVAAELVRMLNGQWWYGHNTGDHRAAAAQRAQTLVREALRRHGVGESTAQRLAAGGKVLDPAVAYASGPELQLAAQIGLA